MNKKSYPIFSIWCFSMVNVVTRRNNYYMELEKIGSHEIRQEFFYGDPFSTEDLYEFLLIVDRQLPHNLKFPECHPGYKVLSVDGDIASKTYITILSPTEDTKVIKEFLNYLLVFYG